MTNWMNALADHYEIMRSGYPSDRLLLLFDIDGTILDTRHAVLYLLREYDRVFRTELFQGLEIVDIDIHENRVGSLLNSLGLPIAIAEPVISWYNDRLWCRDVVLEGYRPFTGVMEVMRWFQIQPNVNVGINTGRVGVNAPRHNPLSKPNRGGVQGRLSGPLRVHEPIRRPRQD